MACGIYKITNTHTRKYYIGYSQNIKVRLQNHLSQLAKGTHCNKHLQSAWRRSGKETFITEIVEGCPKAQLCKREHFWCMQLQSHNRKFGYNILPTDPNGRPKRLSRATRQRMSKSGKRRQFSEQHRKNIGLAHKGRKMLETVKLRLLAYHTGRKHTLEEVAKRKLAVTTNGKAKKVLQYNKDGTFVKEWLGSGEVHRQLGYPIQSISRCCRGERLTAQGFIWKYKEQE